MSIDVVGSTTIKSGENEQDVIYTFLAYHKRVSDLTYTCHGEVINITGDGIMCRFLRSEDAATLVESILGQQTAFNKRLNRLSRPLTLRLGVHTGEVYENQSLDAGQWISHTIDIAAKLQQSAQPDTARFSEATMNELKNRPGAYRRVGWDASLSMNVYAYQSQSTIISRSHSLPDPTRILVLEHELDEIVRLKKILSGRRHDTLTVYNQNQAALGIAAWNPHLILLSTDLPWETGWELLLSLRADEDLSKVPIIVMSRQTTGEIIQKTFRMGANGFLRKPLEDQQIIKRVEMVLREFYL
ncbi:MAG: response regulator [Elusimicrobiota bacterium]